VTAQDRPEPSSVFGKLRTARAPVNPGDTPPSKTEPPFDPTSWGGALIVMGALGALLWVIQFINAATNYRLDRYGLRPRTIAGLEGIITSPFLHASYAHLLANSAPFVLIGWALLLSGVRPFLLASGIIIVVGGLLTWLVAPSGLVVGASGLIMGWLGYLLARAYFSRRIVWIIGAVAVVGFFGGLLGGLLPSVNSDVSWQGHVAGFVAGILAGWVLHPRTARVRRRTRPQPQPLS
jgi:membrane associated rhomboid family serine protease